MEQKTYQFENDIGSVNVMVLDHWIHQLEDRLDVF
jgi:hypothetical protein